VAPRPIFLTTAIEAVVRAGDLQMAHFGRAFQIDKKGTIDLVTEVDVAVERMFRALIAERFPDHQVLAEEMGGAAIAPAGPCWVFDPIDGTTNFAHGLPIFCSSLALEIDGVAEILTKGDDHRHALNLLAGKYKQYEGMPLRDAPVIRVLSQADLVSEEVWGDGLQLLFRLAEAITQGMTASVRAARAAAAPPGTEPEEPAPGHAELTAVACLMMLERVNYLLSVEVRLPKDEMVHRLAAIIYAAFAS